MSSWTALPVGLLVGFFASTSMASVTLTGLSGSQCQSGCSVLSQLPRLLLGASDDLLVTVKGRSSIQVRPLTSLPSLPNTFQGSMAGRFSFAFSTSSVPPLSIMGPTVPTTFGFSPLSGGSYVGTFPIDVSFRLSFFEASEAGWVGTGLVPGEIVLHVLAESPIGGLSVGRSGAWFENGMLEVKAVAPIPIPPGYALLATGLALLAAARRAMARLDS
jgi:hypothetical protein